MNFPSFMSLCLFWLILKRLKIIWTGKWVRMEFGLNFIWIVALVALLLTYQKSPQNRVLYADIELGSLVICFIHSLRMGSYPDDRFFVAQRWFQRCCYARCPSQHKTRTLSQRKSVRFMARLLGSLEEQWQVLVASSFHCCLQKEIRFSLASVFTMGWTQQQSNLGVRRANRSCCPGRLLTRERSAHI